MCTHTHRQIPPTSESLGQKTSDVEYLVMKTQMQLMAMNVFLELDYLDRKEMEEAALSKYSYSKSHIRKSMSSCLAISSLYFIMFYIHFYISKPHNISMFACSFKLNQRLRFFLFSLM